MFKIASFSYKIIELATLFVLYVQLGAVATYVCVWRWVLEEGVVSGRALRGRRNWRKIRYNSVVCVIVSQC